jgi:hypothetical protein
LTERLTGIDTVMALDILRKLAEEGCRVTLTHDPERKIYRIDLEGGPWANLEKGSTYAEGVTFGDVVETSLDLFRRAWSDQVEAISKPATVVQFRCAGSCWHGPCECRKLDGMLNPEIGPPLHDGCACYLDHGDQADLEAAAANRTTGPDGPR